MRKLVSKIMIMLLVLSCTVTFGGWGSGTVEAQALVPVQLISDEDALKPGGKTKLHVIYHHVDNNAQSHTNIKVHLSEDWELIDAGSAEWDESTRFLKWNVHEVENNGAAVYHFQLKLKEGVRIGTQHELEAELDIDGKVKVKSNKAIIMAQIEQHQPFMQGYPDGTFRPEASLTRAETAAAVARIRGLHDNYEPVAYKDVPASHWAHDYIQQVTAEGYMVGYEGSFRPDDPITKAELVILMLRMKGISSVPFESGFSDIKGHWSAYNISTALQLGYLEFSESGKFSPDHSITRELAVKLLCIGLFRGPLADGQIEVEQHFPDVGKEHSYFGWIEEASSVAHESENHGEGLERLIRYLPDQTQPF